MRIVKGLALLSMEQGIDRSRLSRKGGEGGGGVARYVGLIDLLGDTYVCIQTID
jgi:hypothetical protein